MPLFNTYTMPSEATTFELGAIFDSHGNLSTQRNNWTVDWTSRKWYRLGWLWNEDFSAVEAEGMWVGDLDDLNSFEWRAFDVSDHDPFSKTGYETLVGLTAFEGTNYAAVAATFGSTGVDHLLLNLTTGKFIASATASQAETADNIENSPFFLPTTDSNVWHRFDVSSKSRTSFPSTSRLAVIKYDLSAETVTVLVNYETGTGALADIDDKIKCKGRELSTSNTVFCINPDADDGRIFEVTIPHDTTSDSDISFETFKTVDVPTDHSVHSVFYDSGQDIVVYARRKRIGGSAPWAITYEAVARTAPDTILWTEQVTGKKPQFSELHKSSYQHYRITGCTCIDFQERNVIDIASGTVTSISDITGGAITDLNYDVLDMESNTVWSTFRTSSVTVDFNNYYPDNDFTWPDNDDDVYFVQAYTAEQNFGYPNGACFLTGISFGEEKDPNYIDFASIA